MTGLTPLPRSDYDRAIAAIGVTHDEIAEVVFATINACHAEGIHDPLRQAHAVAVALLLAKGHR